MFVQHIAVLLDSTVWNRVTSNFQDCSHVFSIWLGEMLYKEPIKHLFQSFVKRSPLLYRMKNVILTS